MGPPAGNLFLFLALFVFDVQMSSQVCVDIPSDTEAVLGNAMRLTCISCMKREEISARTRVDWYYVTEANKRIPIYVFDGVPQEIDGLWKGRVIWNGSKDLQDLSISIQRVTANDTGTYVCEVQRQFQFDSYTPSFTYSKVIHLVVSEEVSRNLTAVYSEYVMYALLMFLTLWLLVEMVYCYRKVSKADARGQRNAFSNVL
ncbi:sodium channel regulatory subunit beta-3-like isoform X1 [Paramormyrops kingsleyae]|uniref:Sodium channel regulatory subunit beta-3 n=1 Tax=Paramormyrops kingsleyae TaxID=1676925 RepID=A0A3B3TCF8_9TELE|nr:sodium channel subunit beta-3-like isoform X2 [Paramormyrops kingsleyae]